MSFTFFFDVRDFGFGIFFLFLKVSSLVFLPCQSTLSRRSKPSASCPTPGRTSTTGNQHCEKQCKRSQERYASDEFWSTATDGSKLSPPDPFASSQESVRLGATARIVDALFRQNIAPLWAKIHPGLKRRSGSLDAQQHAFRLPVPIWELQIPACIRTAAIESCRRTSKRLPSADESRIQPSPRDPLTHSPIAA